jgi:hypothetical protein
LPELWWNQVLLAAALTAPAIAMAAVANSFTQFVMEVVAVAAAIVFLNSTFNTASVPWARADTVRLVVSVLVVSAASIAIAWMQYFGRRLVVSRGLGVGAGIAAAVVFAILMPASAFAVRSALAPIRAPLTLALLDKTDSPTNWGPSNRVTVAIPVAIKGMLAGALFRVEGLGSTVSSPAGLRYRAATRANYQNFDRIPFENSFFPAGTVTDRGWLYLRFDRAAFDQLKNSGVEIEGNLGVTAYRFGQTSWMGVNTTANTPVNGRCTSSVVENTWSEGLLKVECESPSEIPLPTSIRVWQPETGRDWNERLGNGRPSVSLPRSTWLSPLDRRQAYFQIAEEPKGSGSQWLVPRIALDSVKIAVTPEITTGYSVLKYDLRDLALNNYVVPPVRR